MLLSTALNKAYEKFQERGGTDLAAKGPNLLEAILEKG